MKIDVRTLRVDGFSIWVINSTNLCEMSNTVCRQVKAMVKPKVTIINIRI